MAKEQFNPTIPAKQGLKLSEFLPTGKAWDAKNDSSKNLGALLLALGSEFNRLEDIVQLTNKELDINFADRLIREWELSVGIPDNCFSINGTLSERHVQIITKLRNVRLQTIQDYKDLAALFGVFVNVAPGVPEGASATDKEKRFSITVDLPGQFSGEIFPFPNFFPIPFTSKITSIVQCLFEKIKPANVQLIIQYGQFPTITGTFGGSVDQLVGIMLGSGVYFGTLNGDVGQLSGVINGLLHPKGTLNGDIGQLSGTILGGGVPFVGTLTGDIGQLTGAFTGTNTAYVGTLAGDIGQLTATINALLSNVNWDDLSGNWDDLTGLWDDL